LSTFLPSWTAWKKNTASLRIADYKRLFFRLKYGWAFRAIAFQTAITAPTYRLASPILQSVSEKLRVKHLFGLLADRHLKLSIVMTMLKLHPWIFYCVVRRFNRR
jgi:hypothetical protein